MPRPLLHLAVYAPLRFARLFGWLQWVFEDNVASPFLMSAKLVTL
jgi:hypothetical protein